MTSAPYGASASAAGQPRNGGFAEPSPLELPAPSADDIRLAPPPKSKSKRQKEYEPHIPIVLDDSDEIIELD